MNRDEASLLDIARAAKLIQEFTSGSTFEAFRTDRKTQSAVQHQLLILGEAVKRLTNDFRAQHSQIPWALIAGIRDHLIHSYDAVDLVEVWKTVTDDIPQLLAYIQPLLPSRPH